MLLGKSGVKTLPVDEEAVAIVVEEEIEAAAAMPTRKKLVDGTHRVHRQQRNNGQSFASFCPSDESFSHCCHSTRKENAL